MRRIRPRFTVRTLAILVAIVCAYFAAWDATKRFGVANTPSELPLSGDYGDFTATIVITDVTSPLPFIVGRNEQEVAQPPEGSIGFSGPIKRCYYVWFLGTNLKLPLEFELPQPKKVFRATGFSAK